MSLNVKLINIKLSEHKFVIRGQDLMVSHARAQISNTGRLRKCWKEFTSGLGRHEDVAGSHAKSSATTKWRRDVTRRPRASAKLDRRLRRNGWLNNTHTQTEDRRLAVKIEDISVARIEELSLKRVPID